MEKQEIQFFKKISVLSNQTTLYITFPQNIIEMGNLKKGDLLDIKIKKIEKGETKNV